MDLWKAGLICQLNVEPFRPLNSFEICMAFSMGIQSLGVIALRISASMAAPGNYKHNCLFLFLIYEMNFLHITSCLP